MSRPAAVGERPSAKRRRRWRPAHLAGYGAVVPLLGLALFSGRALWRALTGIDTDCPSTGTIVA